MKNEKTGNKEVKVEVVKRLNINYLEFIKALKNSKISLEDSNKDKIKSLYSSIVKLRFTNLERVNKRVNRKEISKELLSELKSRNISLEEFRAMGEKVVSLSSKKVRNYLSIEK